MVWNIGKIDGDNKEIMTRTETAKIDEIMVRNREEIGLGSEIVSRKERMAILKMKLLEEAAEIETELKRLEEVVVEKVKQGHQKEDDHTNFDQLYSNLFYFDQMLKDLADLASPQTAMELIVLDAEDLKWIEEEVEQAMEAIEKALEYLEKASKEDAHIYFDFLTNNVREALESVGNILETSDDAFNATISAHPGMLVITPETSTDGSNTNITPEGLWRWWCNPYQC